MEPAMHLSRRQILASPFVLLAGKARAQSPLYPLPIGTEDPTLVAFAATLARLPAELAVAGAASGVQIGFGDLAAARELRPEEVAGRPGFRALTMRALPINLSSSRRFDRNLNWRGAGFNVDEVEQIAQVTVGRNGASLVHLSPGIGARVEQTLRETGASAEAEAPNGLPQPTEVNGDLFLQANSRLLLAFLAADARPAVLDDPGIATLVQGLAGLQAGPLVSAFLIPEVEGLAGTDTFLTLTGRRFPDAATGWRGLLFADFTNGPQSTAVLVATLAWPSHADLAPVTQAVARGWEATPWEDTTMAKRFGEVQIEAIRPADGLVRIRLSQTAATNLDRPAVPRNLLYVALVLATLARRPLLLP